MKLILLTPIIFMLAKIFYISKSNEWSLSCNSVKNIIRNKTLRYMIFKEKKIIYMLKYFKKQTQLYYNKTIVSISEGIEKYNNLSDEDKIIVDTIYSLIL